MLLAPLVIIPLIGIFLISTATTYDFNKNNSIGSRYIAIGTSLLNLIISFIVFILFNNSSNQYQFVEEHYQIRSFDIYLGVDGISIYFVLLTTILMPIALLAN